MTPEAFATKWHGSQVRKYTGENCREILKGVPHTEDTKCALMEMHVAFGDDITFMVLMLTECDKSLGNRAARKVIDRARLS